MAGNPEDRQMVRSQRLKDTRDEEPLHEQDVSAYDNGGHFVCGLTSFARKLHRLDETPEVTVEVYRDGIWIDTGGIDE